MSFLAVKEKGSYESYEMTYGNTVEQLLQYHICTLPPENVWIDLNNNDITKSIEKLEYMQQNIEPNNDNGDNKNIKSYTKNTIVYSFRSPLPDGEKVIDKFLNEAFDFYVKKMKDTQDFSRYLYMLIKTPTITASEGEGGNSSETNVRVYKRYKLSDEKVKKKK